MTYKLDEKHFWGGNLGYAKPSVQAKIDYEAVKDLPNVIEHTAEEDEAFAAVSYPKDDGYPTAEQVKAMADELVLRSGKKLSEITETAQNAIEFTNLPTAEEIRRDVAKWASKQDVTKEAVKHDDGKPDWSLVPFESLEGMVKVLEFGAKKYAGWNWTTNGGFPYMRVMRSCLRHLFAWSRGEDIDPESGLSHIHHAMCNLLFISHYIGNKEKYNKDDRQVR
jgi:Domain of unknown function (DUF5664)